MSKNLALNIVIGGVVSSSVSKAFDTSIFNIVKMGTALLSLDTKSRKMKHYKELEKEVEKSRKIYLATASSVNKLKTQVERTKKPSRELLDSFTELNIASFESKEHYEAQRDALKQLGNELVAIAGKSSTVLNTEIKIGNVVDVLRQKYTKLNNVIASRKELYEEQVIARQEKRAGMRAGIIENAIVLAGIGASIKPSIDLAQSLVRLGTVINTDDFESDILKARQYALDFTRDNLGEDVQLIDINYALSSTGLSAEAARLGSGLIAKVATVTGASDFGRVAEVIGGAYVNLGQQIEGDTKQKFTRISELLTKAQFKFGFRNFGQLGESMKIGASVIQTYNLGLEQGITLLGALNTGNIKGSMAATTLRSTLSQLSKASEEFGFTIERNANGGIDFISTLKNLENVLGGFDSLDQETTDRLQAVFGREGLPAVIVLGKMLKSQGKDWAGLAAAQKDVVETSRNIIDLNYKPFLEQGAGPIKLLGKNVKGIGKSFGSAMLPMVNTLISPLTAISKFLSDAIDKFPILAQIGGGFMLIGAAVKVLTGTLSYLFSLVLGGAISIAKMAISYFSFNYVLRKIGINLSLMSVGQRLWAAGIVLTRTAMKGLSLIFSATPIGRVIKAVTVLVGLGVVLYKKWEPFRKLVDGIVGSVIGLFKAIGKGWNKLFSKPSIEVGSTLSVAGKNKAKQEQSSSGMIDGVKVRIIDRSAPPPSRTYNMNGMTLNVNAAPGMDEQALAEKVGDQVIEKIKYQAEISRRGALYDLPDAYTY